MRTFALMGALLVVTSLGCAKTPVTPVDLTALAGGTHQMLYGGLVSAWAKLGSDRKVESAGISLPLASIENAPTGPNDEDSRTILDLPGVVQQTTFLNHVELDWNHAGHEPTQIYGVPHFDFHFYHVDRKAVDAVDCSDTRLPAADDVPANYMFLPPPNGQCVPQMGFHASDMTSPELSQTNPQPFTKTLILGAYGGQWTFIEPMVTRAFLLQKQDFGWDVPKPNTLGVHTLYPTRFDAHFDAETNAWVISFSRFVQTD